MPQAETVILQSSPDADESGWLDVCMKSVQAWASGNAYTYKHCGDVLFNRLDPDLRRKAALQPVVASDLARLLWMQAELDDGATTVVWLDADVLVVEPSAMQLPDGDFAPGREVWVQAHGGGHRTYRKVHNAALLARHGTPVLPYYIRAAEQILRKHRPGHMVPQLIGPKLLTALHNIAAFEVWNDVGMLSPAVAQDLLGGGGPAMEQFLRDAGGWPPALNLCRSSVPGGALSDAQMRSMVEQSRQLFVN